MKITILSGSVEIALSDNTIYHMSWDSLNKVEKAIEIIRNIQNTAPLERAVIEII